MFYITVGCIFPFLFLFCGGRGVVNLKNESLIWPENVALPCLHSGKQENPWVLTEFDETVIVYDAPEFLLHILVA